MDPASDRPVVAWLGGGGHAHVEYAAGAADPAYRSRSAFASARGGTHWLRTTLAALAGLALLAGLAWALLRRRARGSTGGSTRS